MTPLRLFIDAGGSHTRAMLTGDDLGVVLGSFGSLNPASGRFSVVFDDLAGFLAAHAGSRPLTGIIASASVSRPTLDREVRVWSDALDQRGFSAELWLLNDGMPLVIQPDREPQVGVVLGTGSCFLLQSEGRVRRFGGMEWLGSDEAGGSQLGLLALRSLARAHDGRGPRTRLHDRLEAHCHADAEQLLRVMAELAHPKPAIADLGKLVLEVAFEEGDPCALGIVDQTRREIAEYIAAVLAARGASTTTQWRLTGGLLENTGYKSMVADQIRAADPGAIVEVPSDMLKLLPTADPFAIQRPNRVDASSGSATVSGVSE